jgi:dihydroorotate dehydrogenase electron transfer subunit
MMPLVHRAVRVLENVQLARDTWRIRLDAPDLAERIRPGQFLMLRLPNVTDPLLGRPFALYDTVIDDNGRPIAVDVVYLVVGKLTRALSRLAAGTRGSAVADPRGDGDQVLVWGPLGNGFLPIPKSNHIALVAGGIGQTPFLAYARQLLGQRGYGGAAPVVATNKVTLYYGVRTAELAAGVADFEATGATVQLASDDGSIGFKGFVTQLVEQKEPPDCFVGCGPEPMMKGLAALARRWDKPCQLSLETPMACGVGICFSCVTKVNTAEGWDYRRVCLEGPVFDAGSLAWN